MGIKTLLLGPEAEGGILPKGLPLLGQYLGERPEDPNPQGLHYLPPDEREPHPDGVYLLQALAAPQGLVCCLVVQPLRVPQKSNREGPRGVDALVVGPHDGLVRPYELIQCPWVEADVRVH